MKSVVYIVAIVGAVFIAFLCDQPPRTRGGALVPLMIWLGFIVILEKNLPAATRGDEIRRQRRKKVHEEFVEEIRQLEALSPEERQKELRRQAEQSRRDDRIGCLIWIAVMVLAMIWGAVRR